jgi:hypothetical protein
MSDSSHEGFYRKRKGSSKYLTIRGECFAEAVAEGTEGAESRVNKKGNTVWEILHDNGYEGQLRAVYIPEDKHNYGRQLCLRFKSVTIQVPLSSNHFKKFVRVCRNIDLEQNIIILPYHMPKKDERGNVVKDKFISGWNLYQGGDEKENKLPDEIDASKDGPVPAMTKKKIKGKDTWDDSDQIEYYEEYLNEWLDENKEYFDQFKSEKSVTEKDEEEPDEEEEEEDDDPPPVKKKAVSKPVVKKKKQVEEEEEDDDNVPF